MDLETRLNTAKTIVFLLLGGWAITVAIAVYLHSRGDQYRRRLENLQQRIMKIDVLPENSNWWVPPEPPTYRTSQDYNEREAWQSALLGSSGSHSENITAIRRLGTLLDSNMHDMSDKWQARRDQLRHIGTILGVNVSKHSTWSAVADDIIQTIEDTEGKE